MIRIMLAMIAIFLSAPPAISHEYQFGELAIVHPYANPTALNGSVSGGYMEIFNAGQNDDRLLAVETGVADVSFFDARNGVRLQTSIALPSGEFTVLQSDDLHIRLSDLKEPLSVGDRFPMTLIFENAGQFTVEFWVEGDAIVTPPSPSLNEMTVAESDENIQTLIRRTLGAQTKIVTLVVEQQFAVVGWLNQHDGGRAFMRRSDNGWQIVLLSGEGLATYAGLRAQGIAPSVSGVLLAELEAAESQLPAESLQQMNRFQGTILIAPP